MPNKRKESTSRSVDAARGETPSAKPSPQKALSDADRGKWTMPDWMEPYRGLICNTGGNSIERMMNGHTDPVINLPVSTLEACVKSQVILLYALQKHALLALAKARGETDAK